MLNIDISTSKQYAVVSDIYTYIIEIKNEYNFELEDVIIKSLLDEQLRFIKETVVSDVTSNDENIISGINIGNLKSNSKKIIKFDVEVISQKHESINVTFLTEYKYREEGENRKFWEANTIEAKPIKICNPTLDIVLESDTKEVQLGDSVLYTIKLHNNSDIDLYNIYLMDTLPPTTELIDGSFYVGSKNVNSVDIKKGAILGDLCIGESITIVYKVKVVSSSSGGKIKNNLKVKYYFKLDDYVSSYKESEVYSIDISMGISNFKYVSINNYLSVGNKKSKLEEIIDIKPKAMIDKCFVIKTTKGISKEGSVLSGYKLIVHGSIIETIEYESSSPISCIYSSQYETPFSTHIVLPSDFIVGTKVEVDVSVDGISYNKVSEDKFYRSLDLILIGKLRCN